MKLIVNYFTTFHLSKGWSVSLGPDSEGVIHCPDSEDVILCPDSEGVILCIIVRV